MKLPLFCACFVVLAILMGTVDRVSAGGPKREPDPPRAGRSEAAYRGGLVTPPLPKPQFTLTDTSGAPFDLRLQTKGYVTLLFFGYTHCPDMCPLQMSLIGRVLKKMPVDEADQYKVIFVTTDPARDTPKALRSWLDNFDKRFIGLTGSDPAIKAAQIASGLPPAEKSAAHSDGTYDVGHAAFVLTYTKDNFAHVIYPVGVPIEDFMHDLPLLVGETWSNQ